MTTLLLVFSLGLCSSDSLAPPTLLAPGKRDTLWYTPPTECSEVCNRLRLARSKKDTLWQTPIDPLRQREPYDPKTWTREPPPLPRKQRPALRTGLNLALPFVSGALWGLHETLQHHWPAFERKHPGANPHWWNPAESWGNKYRNRDPEQGRTGWPAQVTDAKHLLVLGHNATLFGAGVCIGIGKPRKWWRYALDAGASLVSYSAGNYLTYQFYQPP